MPATRVATGQYKDKLSGCLFIVTGSWANPDYDDPHSLVIVGERESKPGGPLSPNQWLGTVDQFLVFYEPYSP